ncbi:MAG: polysaccharide biosynthesis tyrosine autokinase [Armatimonadetes bacterium]|nr:polysaccharide biosynthesis tyrosine autokinase [Armatimonadota bacterium]
MEFWKIYRIVKARRWMILGLLLITLLTVYTAKKVVDENTQYAASALVLPSTAAMSAGGLFQDRTRNGVMSPTYDRYSRTAQFLQNIKMRFPDALQLAGEPAVDQKRALVQALSSKMTVDMVNDLLGRRGKDKIKDLNSFLASVQDERDLDPILRYFHIPTDDSIWVARDFKADARQQMRDGLFATPVYDTTVNMTPGSSNPTPVPTDYLQIVMKTTDANTATQLANLVAAAFINGYKNEGLTDYNNTIRTARAQLEKAQSDLTKARAALTEFRQKQPYVELPTAANVAINNLVSLDRSRQAAELQLQVALRSAATYSQLAQATGASRTVKMNPLARPQVMRLQEQVQDLQAQLATLQSRYSDAMPQVQHAQAELKARKAELATLLSQPYEQSTPNAEYTALLSQADAARAEAARAQTTIAGLDTQIAQQRAQNQTLPQAENTLSQLTEDVTLDQASVAAASQQVMGLKTNNSLFKRGLISLEEAAAEAVPDTSGPGLATLLIYGAILSLIIGIAAAIGLDYLDNSVQTIPDAEKLLGMPVSAVIPAMPPGDPRRQTRLTVSDPLSPIAEAYRLLRTDLLFTADEKPFQSLMAATAKPGQGATTTICNLAVALAAVGKRVILIDADLRRPKLHGFFNVSNETGLTSLLRDECELEEALKVTDIDNLLVLPSGPLPLNPAELLASHKMRALHERLKPHTDFILVDTPSAIAFSDSAILASFLDAVMLVVRAQETPRGSEIQLKNLLNKARANVVGVVLNGVKPQLVDSYFYHAAYYPQITPGNGHALANGGVLPPPPNGSNGNGGSHKTLEGENVGEAVSVRSAAEGQHDIESTAVMDDVIHDDIVTVTPPKPRPRFSLRRRPGNDDRN